MTLENRSIYKSRTFYFLFIFLLLFFSGCDSKSSDSIDLDYGLTLNDIYVVYWASSKLPKPKIGSTIVSMYDGGSVTLWHDDVASYLKKHKSLGAVRGLSDISYATHIIDYGDGVKQPDEFESRFIPFSASSPENTGQLRVCDIFYYVYMINHGQKNIFKPEEPEADRDIKILRALREAIDDASIEIPFPVPRD